MINLCKPYQTAHEEAIVSLNYPGGIFLAYCQRVLTTLFNNYTNHLRHVFLNVKIKTFNKSNRDILRISS